MKIRIMITIQNSFLNNTSNEYTLQGVYNAKGFIGSIADLSQVFLAIYETSISPPTYTGSENIDITNNEITLNFPSKINDEIVFNPRVNGHFEMYAGTSGFSVLQNTVDGSQPIANLILQISQLNSSENLISQIIIIKLKQMRLMTNYQH